MLIRDPWLALSYWSGQLSQDWQRVAQARRIKTKRGAAKRPGLAEITSRLETALLASYHRLERDIVASLWGRSDDLHTGRLGQALSDEESEALDYYGVPESDANDKVDKSRLAAILVLISLWRRRHVAIADDAVGSTFALGRKEAVRKMGLTDALVSRDTSKLRDDVLKQYQADIDRLENGLIRGTARSQGVEAIVEGSVTLGEAMTKLRELWDEEEFRVQMLAESLTWSAWQSGVRTGAVDATAQLIRDNGPDAQVPEWSFEGPQDSRTCGPCSDYIGTRVRALAISDLPPVEGICIAGRSCRHSWEIVS